MKPVTYSRATIGSSHVTTLNLPYTPPLQPMTRSSHMAFDAYLKIDGIPGESSDDKHLKEITLGAVPGRRR